MEGWVKLHRQLLDKPIWKCSTPEQKVILITLLMMVSHKPNEWNWNGEKYTIKPGQCITSLKSITENSGLGISIKNVRTAIDKFEKYEFLANKSTNKNRLITILNWELYQVKENESANKSASNRQATGNYQECKNEKKIDIAHFDTFWNAYPRKISKGTARKAFEKLKVTEELLKIMLRVLESQSKQWKDKQFIPYPATWLNSRRWEDEDDNATDHELTVTNDGTFKF
ncbi:hypothetical protein [[Clostridium] fimetarium]|uniref:Phage replication protein O n=1 Tax=[Clostridium] fimetarium TaxID=99656 RepID=A0A1I0LZS1_9FIRM|nr:hypothetical protein [[Clostridium] fimetarium]SEV81598.1 hypothetical protein SAMN05421659_10127 [[Clostridium] fimetarium]